MSEVLCRYCGKPATLLGNLECNECSTLNGIVAKNINVVRQIVEEIDRSSNRVWFDLLQTFETRGVYQMKEGTAADSPVSEQVVGETEVTIFLRRCSGTKTFAIKVNREVADFFMKP